MQIILIEQIYILVISLNQHILFNGRTVYLKSFNKHTTETVPYYCNQMAQMMALNDFHKFTCTLHVPVTFKNHPLK